uniref:Uncharacterized protein n=1 Tax=Romanomermis culicivorax TaxID=13658 RepID=A0A915K8U2_ROMCU
MNIKYLVFSIHRKNGEKINCEAAGNLACITLNDEDLDMLTGGDIIKLLEKEVSRNTNEEFDKLNISRIIGTILHEIGHLLDLGHVKKTVMSDEYWKIGKYFVSGGFDQFRCFDKASLSILNNHKWMNSNNPSTKFIEKVITFDRTRNRIVRCEDEIYAIQIRRFEDGETLYSRIFDDNSYPIKIWTLPGFEKNSPIDHQKIVLFVMIRAGDTARFVTSVGQIMYKGALQ